MTAKTKSTVSSRRAFLKMSMLSRPQRAPYMMDV